MRLGLVFEGCAGRAAFHAGVADRLQAAGLAPDCVAGASSGSIVAALVAGGMLDRLPEIWLSGADQPVFQPARLLKARWPLAMSSIVGDVLEELFGAKRLGELTLPIAIPVTLMTLSGRRRRLLTGGDDITVVEAVLASCFIPGPYSRVVVVDHCLAVDGAWDVRTPIDAVQHLGATRIVAVVTNPGAELQLGFPTRDRMQPPFDCVVVGPGKPLPIGAWDTDRGRVQAAIGAGRLAAGRALAAGHFPEICETAT